MEAELKLRLPSGVAFTALCLRHAPGKRGIKQRNQFFDTKSEALASSNFHLRLRTEQDQDRRGSGAEKFIVTAKGPKMKPKGAAAGSSIAIRPEEEVEVDATTAHAIQRGTSPLDVLPASDLTDAMRALAAGQPIAFNGAAFDNTRVRTTVVLPASDTLGDARHITLEIDATRFEWAGESEEQWELECELPAAEATSLAAPVEAALQALVRDACGCDACPPAQGKLSRLKKFRKKVELRSPSMGHGKSPRSPPAPKVAAAEREAAEADSDLRDIDGAQSDAPAAAGLGGHMLAFERQAAFEAWLRQCPLAASALAEYTVTRTQSGFDLRCYWQLPLTPMPSAQRAPAAAATPSSTPAPTPAPPPAPPPPAGPPSPPPHTLPAAPSLPSMLPPVPQPPPARPASGEDAAGTLAQVHALLQAAQAPTASSGLLPAPPTAGAMPDAASTLAFVKRSLATSRCAQPPGVPLPPPVVGHGTSVQEPQTSDTEISDGSMASTTGASDTGAATRASWDDGSARPDPPKELEEGGAHSKTSAAAPGSGGALLVRGEQPPTERLAQGYLWAQSLGEVGVSLRVPAGTRSRSLRVDFRPRALKVTLLSQSAPASQALLDVPLLCAIAPEGCTWTIETRRAGEADVVTLQIALEKAQRGTFWRCLSEGHQSIEMPQRWPLVGV